MGLLTLAAMSDNSVVNLNDAILEEVDSIASNDELAPAGPLDFTRNHICPSDYYYDFEPEVRGRGLNQVKR